VSGEFCSAKFANYYANLVSREARKIFAVGEALSFPDAARCWRKNLHKSLQKPNGAKIWGL
jgi:hypothetical protein